MMMNVLSKPTLMTYCEAHPDVADALKAWYFEARHACWKTPADIKRRYPSADFLNDNRVVFNIKGNHYRLIAKINYHAGAVYIRFIGTHAEYDRMDAEKV